MKFRLMFPSLLLLSGCVTVAMPTPVVPQTTAVAECKPYEPPYRERVPKEPQIEDDRQEYVKYLEEVAESLALHVVTLRTYIQNEHELEDRALKRHRDSCP